MYTSEESLEECQQFDHLSDMAMGGRFKSYFLKMEKNSLHLQKPVCNIAMVSA